MNLINYGFNFRGTLSYAGIVKYIKDVLPRHLIAPVNDDNIVAFLESWKMNKVSLFLT